MMLACVIAVVLISCSGAASAVTTPRLREYDLRGIATRHSNEFEPERVAGYFRLNRTHAGEPCCCGDPHHYAHILIWYPAAQLPCPAPPKHAHTLELSRFTHQAETLPFPAAEMFYFYFQVRPCPAGQQ